MVCRIGDGAEGIGVVDVGGLLFASWIGCEWPERATGGEVAVVRGRSPVGGSSRICGIWWRWDERAGTGWDGRDSWD